MEISKIIFTFSFPFRQLYSCYLYFSLNSHFPLNMNTKSYTVCSKMMLSFLREFFILWINYIHLGWDLSCYILKRDVKTFRLPANKITFSSALYGHVYLMTLYHSYFKISSFYNKIICCQTEPSYQLIVCQSKQIIWGNSGNN